MSVKMTIRVAARNLAVLGAISAALSVSMPVVASEITEMAVIPAVALSGTEAMNIAGTEAMDIAGEVLTPEDISVQAVVEAQPVIRVAILDFTSAQGSEFTSCDITVRPMAEVGSQLSDAVSARMADWGNYELVGRLAVERAIEEHKLSKKGLHAPETLKKLAELLDVNVLLIGQTEGTAWSGKGHAGGSLYAAVQLLSANSDVLWSLDGSVTDSSSSSRLVSTLADDMMNRLYADIQVVDSIQSMLALNKTER